MVFAKWCDETPEEILAFRRSRYKARLSKLQFPAENKRYRFIQQIWRSFSCEDKKKKSVSILC